MRYSESFWLSVGGLGAGLAGLALYYFRSTLLTSRCSDIVCCCGLIKIKNQPIDAEDIPEILATDRPPTPVPQRDPQQPRIHSSHGTHDGHSRSRFYVADPTGPNAV